MVPYELSQHDGAAAAQLDSIYGEFYSSDIPSLESFQLRTTSAPSTRGSFRRASYLGQVVDYNNYQASVAHTVVFACGGEDPDEDWSLKPDNTTKIYEDQKPTLPSTRENQNDLSRSNNGPFQVRRKIDDIRILHHSGDSRLPLTFANRADGSEQSEYSLPAFSNKGKDFSAIGQEDPSFIRKETTTNDLFSYKGVVGKDSIPEALSIKTIADSEDQSARRREEDVLSQAADSDVENEASSLIGSIEATSDHRDFSRTPTDPIMSLDKALRDHDREITQEAFIESIKEHGQRYHTPVRPPEEEERTPTNSPTFAYDGFHFHYSANAITNYLSERDSSSSYDSISRESIFDINITSSTRTSATDIGDALGDPASLPKDTQQINSSTIIQSKNRGGESQSELVSMTEETQATIMAETQHSSHPMEAHETENPEASGNPSIPSSQRTPSRDSDTDTKMLETLCKDSVGELLNLQLLEQPARQSKQSTWGDRRNVKTFLGGIRALKKRFIDKNPSIDSESVLSSNMISEIADGGDRLSGTILEDPEELDIPVDEADILHQAVPDSAKMEQFDRRDIDSVLYTLQYIDQAVETMDKMRISDSRSVGFFLANLKGFRQGVEYFHRYRRPSSPKKPGSRGRTQQITRSWLGSHFEKTRTANSSNWQAIKKDLPKWVGLASFTHNIWTIDASSTPTHLIPFIPLRIAQRPVVLNYSPIIFGSFSTLRDPLKTQINPRRNLNDDTLRLLFQTYPNAKAAYVLLNGTLLILHEDNLNIEKEFYRRPRTFGGLRVNYVTFRQNFTTGSTHRISRSARDKTPKPVIESVGTPLHVTYTPARKGISVNQFENHDIRAGLRLKHKKDNLETLTFPVHGLSSIFEQTVDDLRETEEFERLTEKLGTQYTAFVGKHFGFSCGPNRPNFGAIHKDFEDKRKYVYRKHEKEKPIDKVIGKPLLLMHDLGLIKALPNEAHHMPYLILKDPDGNPVKMEWIDTLNEDLICKPIYLLGFGGNLDRSRKLDSATYEESGATIFPPGAFNNPNVDTNNGIQIGVYKNTKQQIAQPDRLSPAWEPTRQNPNSLEITPAASDVSLGKRSVNTAASASDHIASSSEGPRDSGFTNITTSASTVESVGAIEGTLYVPTEVSSSRLLQEYFQRSYIWRSDFIGENGELKYKYENSDNPPELPDMRGASGCPLAIKVKENGTTVYKIFGFQNAELYFSPFDEPRADPAQRAEKALAGTFRTFQSLQLPEDLIAEWDITKRLWKKVDKVFDQPSLLTLRNDFQLSNLAVPRDHMLYMLLGDFSRAHVEEFIAAGASTETP
ncbi:hypothetical protein H072_361 [Dactylellina haptotyla CBS 200.50]|uniref:Uncharacterized protein n=1 Tax=Dactylellina haptotyla (strain CBS 200.50) TaxID=1284197 RepID=S8C1N0_DACHA|nr:hypothetical protein H072_361 [Dactylellina haptotyla CBS 200.50]